LREATATSPVITTSRQLSIIPAGLPGATERLQDTDFTEEFMFDGTAGTVDSDGVGPFASDNLLFVPTPVGFKNSRIRLSGYLTCQARPDGSVQAVTGTLSSVGLNVTGARRTSPESCARATSCARTARCARSPRSPTPPR
jgi:hypothetical protein